MRATLPAPQARNPATCSGDTRMPSVNKNPTASSKSWPGVRIVIETARWNSPSTDIATKADLKRLLDGQHIRLDGDAGSGNSRHTHGDKGRVDIVGADAHVAILVRSGAPRRAVPAFILSQMSPGPQRFPLEDRRRSGPSCTLGKCARCGSLEFSRKSEDDKAEDEWAHSDSNREPRDYESPALPLSYRPESWCLSEFLTRPRFRNYP